MNWLSNLFGGMGNAAQGAGNSIGGFLGNMFGGGGGGGQQAAQGAAKGAAQGGGNSMFGQFNPGMMGAGMGMMGLGQMMNHPAKMPDFQNMPQVQALNNWQSQPNHPLDPNVQQGIQNTLNIQNEQQLRNLRDVYKNLRPGTDYSTDSNYQRDLGNLNRQMAMQGADAMGSQQLASNQQQLGNLTNMAQLGVGQGMGQAALQAQHNQQRNQMFGDVGSMFMQRGLGMPNFMNMFNRGMF